MSRRPELLAGGFSRNDGTIAFYARVRALLPLEGTVIDFGAGRGAAADDPVALRRSIQDLRSDRRVVIGVDLDPAVLVNPLLDRAIRLESDLLPFADESVDTIVADAVFEHITQPEVVAGEFARILRPGGWICARTPNRHGYIAAASRIIPDFAHGAILRRAQPARKSEDVFPTVYRMNTMSRLETLFPPPRFMHASYGFFADPAYVGNSNALYAAQRFVERFLPERLAPILMVFLHKTAD